MRVSEVSLTPEGCCGSSSPRSTGSSIRDIRSGELEFAGVAPPVVLSALQLVMAKRALLLLVHWILPLLRRSNPPVAITVRRNRRMSMGERDVCGRRWRLQEVGIVHVEVRSGEGASVSVSARSAELPHT